MTHFPLQSSETFPKFNLAILRVANHIPDTPLHFSYFKIFPNSEAVTRGCSVKKLEV